MTEVLEPVKESKPVEEQSPPLFISLHSYNGEQITKSVPLPPVYDGVIIRFEVTRGGLDDMMFNHSARVIYKGQIKWESYCDNPITVYKGDLIDVTLYSPTQLIALVTSIGG